MKRQGITAVCITFFLAITGAGCSSGAKKEPDNTVRIFHPEKIKGLDPVYSTDVYAGLETALAYEGLLQYHYLKRPYSLIPNLAESMPEISTDGKIYTFKIKKGVLFQDDDCFKETGSKGRELTADDFVYSWMRIADPKVASTGWWVFDGKIVGLNDWREEASKNGADYSKTINGLKAVDRYTLRIILTQPSPVFLYALALPVTFVVPKEAVQSYGSDFRNRAIGTGPFKLQEYNPALKIVWVRNPTYRSEIYPSEGEAEDKQQGLLDDAGKELPLSEKVVAHIFVEDQPVWLNFMSGNLDYISIPKDNFDQAVNARKEINPELKAKGIELRKSVRLDVTRDTFNMADSLIGKNKFLRQALSLAFDGKGFIELFFNGKVVAAQGPIPPGLPGYDPNLKNPYMEFNLTKAKELLAKAGYPNGKGLPPIEYLSQSSSIFRQMTEFYEKSLQQIGVKLKVSFYSWPEYQNAIRTRRGQIWGQAWNADYPDAENFLQLFYSKNSSPGPNDSNYSNPVFDRLFEKSVSILDINERARLYKKMVQILVEDCPWLYKVHRVDYDLVHPWLKNYKRSIFDSGRIKYLRVDSKKKIK